MAHNPEDSAGAQLALAVAVNLLLSRHRGDARMVKALEEGLEHMRAHILASSSTERKLQAFEEVAETLQATISGSPADARRPDDA